MSHESASSVYRTAGGDARRQFGPNARQAARYYRGYLRFVATHVPSPSTVLDLGCGSGWSSWLLTRQGHEVVGLDVDPQAFEPPPTEGLRFAAGTALHLPFPDGAFDAVTSYQMLEHVEKPDAALAEMARVTRPGGVVLVAGPNLLSPLNSLRQIAWGCWRNRPLSTIFLRQPRDPRLPFGHTLPEALVALGMNTGRLVARALTGGGEFPHREPDMRPPARGDRDACILLNPMDVAAHFRRKGWSVIATSYPGRPRWTGPLAGGTWVAARKPAAPRGHRP